MKESLIGEDKNSTTCQKKQKYVIITFGAISFLRSVSGPDGSSTKYGAYVLFFFAQNINDGILFYKNMKNSFITKEIILNLVRKRLQ